MSGVLFALHVVNPEWGIFQSDLRSHISWAQQVDAGERGWSSRPLLQAAIVLGTRLPGVSYGASAVAVLTAAVAAGYAVTLWLLRRAASDRWTLAGLAVVAVGLTMASAVYAPVIRDSIYSRIGTPNVWHNPTQVVLAPLVIAGFYAALRWLDCGSRRWAVTASALLAATTLVKPNWALAFLPALGLYVLARRRDLMLPGLALVAPTLAVLAVQYLMVFGGDPDTGSGVGIAVGLISHAPMRLVYAVLALAFPLAILAVPDVRRDPGLALAWLVVAVAFAQRMFLIETGPRESHGNWHWGYFAALKVAITWSAVALVRVRPLTGRVAVAWSVLLLHAWSGKVYVHRIITGQGFLG